MILSPKARHFACMESEMELMMSDVGCRMSDVTSKKRCLPQFRIAFIIISRRTERAARAKESLLSFGRVAFEEDDSQIAEIAEIADFNKNLENTF